MTPGELDIDVHIRVLVRTFTYCTRVTHSIWSLLQCLQLQPHIKSFFISQLATTQPISFYISVSPSYYNAIRSGPLFSCHTTPSILKWTTESHILELSPSHCSIHYITTSGYRSIPTTHFFIVALANTHTINCAQQLWSNCRATFTTAWSKFSGPDGSRPSFLSESSLPFDGVSIMNDPWKRHGSQLRGSESDNSDVGSVPKSRKSNKGKRIFDEMNAVSVVNSPSSNY